MSVTDELRELFDEMGVTWRPCGPLVTKWQYGRYEYAAREINGELYVSIPQAVMTPELAVDLTLQIGSDANGLPYDDPIYLGLECAVIGDGLVKNTHACWGFYPAVSK